MTSRTGKNRRPVALRGTALFPRGPRRSAFTLIEVLVSIVILSTGLVMVLRAFETAVVALQESRDSLWASILIREKMDEFDLELASRRGKSPSSASGFFSGRYDGFQWERDVETASDVDQATGTTATDQGELSDVAVTVWRKGSSRKYAARTYVYTP